MALFAYFAGLPSCLCRKCLLRPTVSHSGLTTLLLCLSQRGENPLGRSRSRDWSCYWDGQQATRIPTSDTLHRRACYPSAHWGDQHGNTVWINAAESKMAATQQLLHNLVLGTIAQTNHHLFAMTSSLYRNHTIAAMHRYCWKSPSY